MDSRLRSNYAASSIKLPFDESLKEIKDTMVGYYRLERKLDMFMEKVMRLECKSVSSVGCQTDDNTSIVVCGDAGVHDDDDDHHHCHNSIADKVKIKKRRTLLPEVTETDLSVLLEQQDDHTQAFDNQVFIAKQLYKRVKL